MRTGILTLHYGFNEGAILQAYALSELLRSVCGGTIEIVDQRYPSKLAVYGDPDRTERTRALTDSIDRWLPLSPEHPRVAGSGPLIRELGERYDRLVFGSDVLWGLHYKRRLRGVLGRGILPRQTDPFFPAFPNVYWPNPAQRCDKLTFAASIGSFDPDELPASHRDAIREGLESCRGVGVRDERTRDFVAGLSPSLADRVRLVADPTFARPFRDRLRPRRDDPETKATLVEMGVDFGRPRCLVIARDGAAANAAVERFAALGWQTVAVTAPNERCELRLHDRGFYPLAWARLFGCFDACITERMHGVIFSLLHGTPFVAIEMNEPVAGGPTKTRSLLRRFDLEDALLDGDELDDAVVARACTRAIDAAWDWPRTQDRIESAADAQIAFLRRCLQGDGAASSTTGARTSATI